MKKKLLFLAVLTLHFVAVKAQYAIQYIDQIEGLKNGRLYVVFKNAKADAAQPFIDVWEANWKFSKVEFINEDEIGSKISRESYFVTMGFTTATNDKGTGTGLPQYYFELWNCTDTYYKLQPKYISTSNTYARQIVRIDFQLAGKTVQEGEEFLEKDHYNDTKIRNWGPGILKNQLQYVKTLLQVGKKRARTAEVSKRAELVNLKKDTLFIADYVLNSINGMNFDESKKNKPEDVFKKYGFAYKVISVEDLNDKILETEKPFYYLLYVRCGLEKFVNVVNAATGDVVYSTSTAFAYTLNFKEGDATALGKTIEGK